MCNNPCKRIYTGLEQFAEEHSHNFFSSSYTLHPSYILAFKDKYN